MAKPSVGPNNTNHSFDFCGNFICKNVIEIPREDSILINQLHRNRVTVLRMGLISLSHMDDLLFPYQT